MQRAAHPPFDDAGSRSRTERNSIARQLGRGFASEHRFLASAFACVELDLRREAGVAAHADGECSDIDVYRAFDELGESIRGDEDVRAIDVHVVRIQRRGFSDFQSRHADPPQSRGADPRRAGDADDAAVTGDSEGDAERVGVGTEGKENFPRGVTSTGTDSGGRPIALTSNKPSS